MNIHNLSVNLLTNNDHEASRIGFLLSSNNWDVSLSWSKEECIEHIGTVPTDALIIYLDNYEIFDQGMLADIVPSTPIVLINHLPKNTETRNWLLTLVDSGCYLVNEVEIEKELKHSILSAVLFYRSGEMAAA
ncbi:hypothetical protein HBN50_02275 [Halobacteriovorax sp. GB3]|uniref:hypothetical protein n=1 Tax=Halobacteriovorax sp. GB3 TaxID=2719615 RepID=UPI002360F8EC|nr:hypothetical protein [Halobacteriovorax sp. GB3]MDD0851899.1 hypothetical protein [Halobacteriovorax sp. GB3]